MKAGIITSAVITVVIAFSVTAWYASGRDLQTLRDGMSSEFRQAGTKVVDSETLAELQIAARTAKRASKTREDARLYGLMSSYLQWMEKETETNSKAEDELREFRIKTAGDPAYARVLGPTTKEYVGLLLKHSEEYLTNAGNCHAELELHFPLSPNLALSNEHQLPKTDGKCVILPAE